MAVGMLIMQILMIFTTRAIFLELPAESTLDLPNPFSLIHSSPPSRPLKWSPYKSRRHCRTGSGDESMCLGGCVQGGALGRSLRYSVCISRQSLVEKGLMLSVYLLQLDFNYLYLQTYPVAFSYCELRYDKV